ncbi:MAG: ATP-binding cassette domain-containing protein [Candidatus Hodarchaeota archaeon]
MKNVSKTFGNRFTGLKVEALRNVTFSLKRGEILSILGRNGSGKSTLLRIAVGLMNPSSGKVSWKIEQLKNPNLANRIGYCPDNPTLYSSVTINEFLMLIGKITQVINLREVIETWLEDLNLTNWKKEAIYKLSKGMTHKVALIATLMDNPQIVILDEPFSSLDDEARIFLKTKISEMVSSGVGVLLADPSRTINELNPRTLLLE